MNRHGGCQVWHQKMPNEDKSKSSTKLSEKPLRKCHHQLCRNQERRKLMSLTCQVPWPPMATRWVALLGGTDLLYLLPRIYFWERPRRKDFKGLMWLRREAQVQQETPCDSRQTHKETAEWQGLVDTISLTLGDSDPLLPIFPGEVHDPYAITKGKSPRSEQATGLKPLRESESLLKLGTNKCISSLFFYSLPFGSSLPCLSPNPLWKQIDSSFGFKVIEKHWLFVFSSKFQNPATFWPPEKWEEPRTCHQSSELSLYLCHCVALGKSLHLLLTRILLLPNWWLV